MSVSRYSPVKKGSVIAAALLAMAVNGACGLYAAADAEPAAAGLTQARAQFAKGQYKEAAAKLELIVKDSPDNAEAHLLLGQSYCKLKNFQKGRDQLRMAIRTGKGSPSAQKANMALLALPRNLTSPKSGAQTRLISSMLGLGRTRGGEAKPTVIDFYAAWCQPCKQLGGALAKAKTDYGDKVAFMTVNVDDPNSQTIMDQYDVSPIPTMVFLSTDGEVVTYSVGYGGVESVNNGIKKILPKVN